MDKCIYLKKTLPEVTFNKAEHIIPAGIGGIKTLPKGMVSDEANESFSKLELDFMRNSIISLPRQFYGPGKRGSRSKNKATKSQVHLLSTDESEDTLSLGYIELGKPHIIPQIRIDNNNNISFHMPFITSSYEEQFLKFLKQLNNLKKDYKIIIDEKIPVGDIILGHFKDKRNDKWYVTVNSKDELELLPNLLNQLKTGHLEINEPKFKKSIVTSHQNMAFSIESFCRICAKITFNYLAFITGSEFVLQDIFNPIREFIINGGDNNFVGLIENDDKHNNILDELSHSNSHLIVLSKLPNNKLIGILGLYGGHFKTIIELSSEFKDDFMTQIYRCNWMEGEEDLVDILKELGYSGFLRFIRHSEGISKEDYLKLEDEIFDEMSLDEIYDNAKEHWESKEQ